MSLKNLGFVGQSRLENDQTSQWKYSVLLHKHDGEKVPMYCVKYQVLLPQIQQKKVLMVVKNVPVETMPRCQLTHTCPKHDRIHVVEMLMICVKITNWTYLLFAEMYSADISFWRLCWVFQWGCTRRRHHMILPWPSVRRARAALWRPTPWACLWHSTRSPQIKTPGKWRPWLTCCLVLDISQLGMNKCLYMFAYRCVCLHYVSVQVQNKNVGLHI